MGSSGERGLWGLEQTGFRAFWFSDWRKVKVESPLESPVSFLNPLLRCWAHPLLSLGGLPRLRLTSQ